ncbi:MAG: PepSY domain-containing protein [Bacteroidota bacterium]
MKKSSYHWVWKWHFIGGLISFPILFILAITGIIYLFKDQYEEPRQVSIKKVQVNGDRLSYQEQWQIAKAHWNKKINSMVIPKEKDLATEFISGRFSGKSSLYVHPYSGEVTGSVVVRGTDMFKVRKLHGELLAGSVGTKIVELVGSWLIVLILSGLFLFFPKKKKDWNKLFRVRLHGPRHVLYRDLHMVGGFWFSIILLLIMAGGMPWTDVWGGGFKWVQKQTGTGYPITWQGKTLKSALGVEPISLDQVITYAQSLYLPGTTTVSLPHSAEGIFSIHNRYHLNLSKQVAIHIDQYSGQEIAALHWHDVGFLMRGRMWAMAFHQGQLGTWNWILVLFTAVGLLGLSTSAVIAFFLRKKPGTWGIPSGNSYRITAGFYVFVAIVSILLPLFGLSVILIMLLGFVNKLRVDKLRRSSAITQH